MIESFIYDLNPKVRYMGCEGSDLLGYGPDVEKHLKRKSARETRLVNNKLDGVFAPPKKKGTTKVHSLDELVDQIDWPYYVRGEDTATDNKSLFLELIKTAGTAEDLKTYGKDSEREIMYRHPLADVSDDVFNKLIKEARRSGTVYRGMYFSEVSDFYAFLKTLKNGEGSRCGPSSLTVFLGVAKAFASDGRNKSKTIGLVLSLDPDKLGLRKVNYSDPRDIDYEPPENIPAGELRTNSIPPSAVKGITVYGTNCSIRDGGENYSGLPYSLLPPTLC